MLKKANHLKDGLTTCFQDWQLDLLAKTRVGIAGAGGLGSNVAMLLARSGMENLTLVDFDVVEPSNLNRQHFWPRHVGMRKVDALAEILLELNPAMRLCGHNQRLTAENLEGILGGIPIWVEALDQAGTKKMFVEGALLSGCQVVSASGLAGIGGKPMRKRRLGRLMLVGDFETGIETANPYAPRVAQAAALLADCVLELALGGMKTF